MSFFRNKGESMEADKPDSMKWHHFVIIAMIIRAAWTLYSGLHTLIGWNYGNADLDAFRITNLYPELKSCETFYGIALVVLGVYVLFAQSRLKNYRKNALRSLMLTYVFSIVIFLVYTIWSSCAVQGSVIDLPGAVLSGLCVVFLIVNGIYYHKRKDLFVH